MKKVIPSVVKREELFITTKLWNTSHKPELVEKELDESLKQLGLEYVDLYRKSHPHLLRSYMALTLRRIQSSTGPSHSPQGAILSPRTPRVPDG